MTSAYALAHLREIALPALYWGLQDAQPAPPGTMQGVHAGSSVLLALLYQLGHGGSLTDAAGAVIRLSPVVLAGWIGLLVTALHLLPIGQLDGGHIAYGLFGRRYARVIGVVTVFLMLGLGLTVWPGLLTWALLITLIRASRTCRRSTMSPPLTRPDVRSGRLHSCSSCSSC